MGAYIGDPYHYAKFAHDTIPPFDSKYAKMRIRELGWFFWFFRQPTAKTPAPIYRIDTSKYDVASRKNVRFGGPENKIVHFDPISPPPKKTQIFRQFSTGQNFASKRP